MSRNVTIGLGLGWVLAVLATVLLIVAPAWSRSKTLRAELDELTIELTKSANEPNLISELAEHLGTLRAFGEGRMTPIPAESDIAGLMHALTAILDRYGLAEREIKMGAATDLARATSIPMTTVIRGPFPDVLAALAEIEGMDRLVRVHRLRVGNDNNRLKSPDRSGFVSATLTMDVFYAPHDGSEASASRK